MATFAQRLADFNTTPPSTDAKVEALACDNVGTYTLPFPCRHINGRWINARTGAAITAQIIGWRSLQPSSR